ncbi:hypothetical protein ACIBI8_22945 [Streptomyces sp. NPDC050529]|uniref:hypothetical protein n=1 Tax=unclassified Streptomyces TaxID=2593676 RepID=UPI002DDBC343|nr:hypothetical protein [Streptomyces sp. NBC_01022]WRZ79592.1 hypothetical protein OG316_04615 [Streptomyces sp. NBC_01022]
MKPGDVFTVVPGEGAWDPQFTLIATTDHLVVWIFEGGDPDKVVVDYAIIDSNGIEVECGRQPSSDRDPS